MRIDRSDYESADDPAVDLAKPVPDRPDQAVRIDNEADRAACYRDLRSAVAHEYGEAAVRHDDADSAWDAQAPRLAAEWAGHSRRWPAADSEPSADDGRPGGTDDPPGSWRDGGRYLDASANRAVEQCCERIHEIEENVLSPSMRRIEQMDPGRELVGYEHRLKGQDRIKEKVAEQMLAQPELDADQAVSVVKDSVRYTFQYGTDDYATGVAADTQRLRSSGFELVELRNTWTDDGYKGINSRWQEPISGQLFEVQFHTRVSFEAKQLTHAAYERLRNPLASRDERAELDQYQRHVNAHVTTPPGTDAIEGYP